MFSLKERQKAVELYIKYGRSAADTVRELGYPTKPTLRRWHREYMSEEGLCRLLSGARQEPVKDRQGHGLSKQAGAA